jgi:hypothetical protein
MSIESLVMSTTTSIHGIVSSRADAVKRALTLAEVLLVYSGILLYIWRWQAAHPRAWILLWAVILASHLAHRDTLRELGLTWFELRSSAELVLPLVLTAYIPLVVYGFARHHLALVAPGRQTLVSFAGYGSWCAVQQYLTQSYFHHRLMSVVRSPHLSSLLVALMFGAAHLPNPVLTVATALAGFLLSEVFARHRNIFPLALAQTVGGFLIAALTPARLMHNMRVGPGYLFYGRR